MPGLRAPPAVGVGDRPQQVAIEAVVAAMLRDIILDRLLGQVHQPPDLRLRSPRGAPSAVQRFWLAARMPADIRPRRFAEPPAEALDVADQRFVATRLGVGHQVGQRTPHQLLLGAALDRLEARRDPGLGRKGREQSLGEAVDGLDLQAAGAVEHFGEQLPRALAAFAGRCARRGERGRFRSSLSLSRTQAASRAPMRFAISAAPALVKVRQRIDSGRAPCSSSRSTRAVRTCVLPVPAEADSAA